MRKFFHLIVGISSAVVGFLFLLAFLVPAVTYKGSSTSTTNVSLFSLLSPTTYSSSSSSGLIATSTDYLRCVLFMIVCLMGLVLFCAGKSSLVRLIGVGIAYSVGTFSCYFYGYLKKSLATLTSGTYETPGLVIFLIFAILLLIVASVVIFDEFFGEKIENSLKNQSQSSSLEDKLLSLKSLLDKGLITQEEYDAKRKAVLDEK